jgi:hypothetical protein
MVLFMVFNATFNNISVIMWQSVLLVGETGISGENHFLPFYRNYSYLWSVKGALSCKVQ